MADRLPDVRGLGGQAIGWLRSQLDFFDPATYPPSDGTGRLGACTALGDLANLLAYRPRLDPSPPERDYVSLIGRLAAIASRRAYRDLIPRQHRSLWLYGLVCGALRVWDRDDPELRMIMQQATWTRYAVSWERLPFRYLDYAHFLRMAGIPSATKDLSSAFQLTIVNRAPNVAELTEEDVYSITHALFYMTDYGLDATQLPPDVDRLAAWDLVDTLLRYYQLRHHPDLVAELIIAAECLGCPDPDALVPAWEYLAQAQRADGRIPGPDHLSEGAVASAIDSEDYREWQSSYHTTVVCALAALATGRRRHDRHGRRRPHDGRRPPRRTPVPITPTALAPSTMAAMARARSWLAAQSPIRELPELDELLGPPAGRHVEQVGGSLRRLTPRSLDHLVEPTSARSVASSRHHLLDWLEAGLIDAYREYRLGDAAIILRALTLTGERTNRVVRDTVEAILSQQRLDGSVGYSAVDDETDDNHRVRLGWTVLLLWALTCFADPDGLDELHATARGWRGDHVGTV